MQAVTAVEPTGRGGHGVHRAQPGRRRLGVRDDRLRGEHDAAPGEVGAPAQVDVVTQQRQRGVEAAEAVPQVAGDEHPGRADGEDVGAVVVLALVALAGHDAGVAPPVPRHGEARL